MTRATTAVRRLRAGVLGVLATATALAVVGGASPTLAAGAVARTASPSTSIVVASSAGERASIAWPEGVEAAAFAVAGLTGASGSSGDTDRRPMASIAKLVLALLVLERMPLEAGSQGPTLTVQESDVAMRSDAVRRGAAVMPMTVGQQLTQRELLDAAMLQSSANAATSLAQWAFGSQDAYVAAANAWLDLQGLGDVEIADASGLSRRNVATASDLVRLMELVDRVPLLRAITGQREARIPGLDLVPNTNGALGREGIDSGKTGSLNASGQTVLVGATATVDGREVRIHAVLLGLRGVSRDDAIAGLVASVADQVVEREVLAAGDPVPVFDVTGTMQLHAGSAITILGWRATDVSVVVSLPLPSAANDPEVEVAVGSTGPPGVDGVVHDAADWEWRVAPQHRYAIHGPTAV